MRTKEQLLETYYTMLNSGMTPEESIKVCTVVGGIWDAVQLINDIVERSYQDGFQAATKEYEIK